MRPAAALAGRRLRRSTPRPSRGGGGGCPDGLGNGPAKGSAHNAAQRPGGHGDEVRTGRECAAVLAEVLAQEPLDAVANGRAADAPPHSQAEAHRFPLAPGDMEDKQPRAEAPPGPEGAGKIRPPDNPGGPREAVLPPLRWPQTVRRQRPFARRRLRTFLPPGVLIRLRNPCVRLRLLRSGW